MEPYLVAPRVPRQKHHVLAGWGGKHPSRAARTYSGSPAHVTGARPSLTIP